MNLGILLNFWFEQLNNEMKTIKEIKENNINKINNNDNYTKNNLNNNINYIPKKEDNNNLIEELLKNNLISIEELEQNLNIFGNYGNIYNKKQKEDFNEGIHEKVNWNKNDKILERYIQDGIYNIIPKHCNNRAIGINYSGLENKENLQLFDFNNNKGQQFEVKYNCDHKYYTIKCLCSNKLLSVDCKNNYKIVQCKENNNINQQWHIVLRDNSYEIISEIKGYLMNVDGF